MTFKEVQRNIEKANRDIAAYTDPKTIAYAKKRKMHYGKLLMEMCEDMSSRAEDLVTGGLITEAYASEIIDTMNNIHEQTLEDLYPCYTESAIAAGFSVALAEATALTSKILTKYALGSIGKLIQVPVKKFITSRINKYHLLFPDAVSVKQLECLRYGFDEFVKTEHVKFQYANKWHERGQRVDVRAYVYNKKIVCAIAYTKMKDDALSDVETVILDGSFRHHSDYYSAFMATQVQLTHPSIERVLKQLKSGWDKQLKATQKEIQESVQNAVLNDKFDYKMELVQEAVDSGILDQYSANVYTEECNKMSLLSIR